MLIHAHFRAICTPCEYIYLSCEITHDISQKGAGVETQLLPDPQQTKTPKAGDLGMLILRYNNRGVPDSMKIHCRIVHTQANRIGLYLFYSKLSELDKQNMDMILETALDNI